MKIPNPNVLSAFISSLFLLSCSSNTNQTSTTTTSPVTQGEVDISTVVNQKMVSGYVTVATSGTNLILKSDGRPDHKTPYWGVGNAKYEAFPSGHASNPGGQILAQSYTMTLPMKPNGASTHEATGMGPIGMALNGVAIFNNVEMGGTAIDAGILSSLDGAGAHPAQVGNYHYHVTGTYTSQDDNNLIGFLRDGFPIIGRKDMDGSYPKNLDAYNGHTAATTEFPNGIYHYHVENVNYLNSGYYILKSGSYYGTKGTFVY
jgi:YHYH protein